MKALGRKLRYQDLFRIRLWSLADKTNPDIGEELCIKIVIDKKNKSLSIIDSGIGMTEDGYFDVRDHNDSWIRVWLKKGAMIVLPTGIYHRFTLDFDYYIKVMWLFVGDPVWSPFNRPHDHLPSRKEYLETFGHKKFSDQAVNAAA